MLRSGAYSDDVIVNLVRRRFVAVMYDVAPPDRNAGDAWAHDPEAVAAVGPMDELRKGRRARGGSQGEDGRVRADSYPAALFLLPDGTRLGDGLWGILPPEKMLAELRAVIAQWPQHFPPGEDERAIRAAVAARPEDPSARLAAARLCWELAEFEEAAAHAAAGLAAGRPGGADSDGAGDPAAHPRDAVRDELLYLQGRALSCLHRGDAARETLLAAAPEAGSELHAAVQVALARVDMGAGAFEAALERLLPLAEFDEPGAWSGTALYYAGLCHHRLGRKDEARALWRRHRTELPFDRLARRSAASLGLREAKAFLNQELIELRGWW